tara:strand:- start:719 stop:1063 length:345 start_codon:yes stop_codon:yes gene_type:complete
MIGKMRHKLYVQTQTRTSDGGGSQSVSYSDSFSIFGMIQPKAGQERVFGDQLEEKVTHIITTRFNRNITFKNRLQYRFNKGGQSFTRQFNIKRVINRDTRDRYLDILCEEGVAT